MHKHIARRAAVVGVVAVAAATLAGCGSDGGDGDSSTLTVWTRTDGESYMRDLAKQYEDANPGTTVEVTAIPNSEVQQKLGSAISAGDSPDVVAIDVVKAPFFIAADAFQDVTDQIGALPYAGDLLEGQLDAGTYEGRNFTVPFTADSSVLFYNKDLFTQAGLDPETPPQTWDEFAAAANAIGALGPDYEGYHFSAGCGGCAAFALNPMIWAAGGDPIDSASGSLNPEATFDDPVVVEFVELLNGMVAGGGITTASQVDGGENYGGSFDSGMLGMVASGSFYLSQLQSTPPDFEVGVATLPGKTAGEGASFAGGDVLAIPAGSPDPDAAWSFIEWVTGDDAQTHLAEDGFTPVRTDLYDSVYSAKGPEWAALAAATLEGRVPYTVAFNALFSDPNGPWVSLMQAGVFGSDVPAAAEAAQRTAQQIVDEAGQ
ncbi:ABC transporter substrate-binding protein [Microbacterium sp. NPDC055357]